MNRNDYIASVLAQMADKSARAEVERELNAHLDDRTAFYIESGYSPAEAEEKAVARMGDGEEAGAKMNLLHTNTLLKTAAIAVTAVLSLLLLMDCFEFFFPFFVEYADYEAIFNLPDDTIQNMWILLYFASSLMSTLTFFVFSKYNHAVSFVFLAAASAVHLFFFSTGLLRMDYYISYFTRQFPIAKIGMIVLMGSLTLLSVLCAANLSALEKTAVKTPVLKRYYRFNYAHFALCVLMAEEVIRFLLLQPK